jgi:hypothetical protein
MTRAAAEANDLAAPANDPKPRTRPAAAPTAPPGRAAGPVFLANSE